MKHVRITLVALMALFGAMLVSRPATAMPVSGLTAAANEISTDIQDVRWWRRHYGWGWGWRRHYAWGWRRHYAWGWRRPWGWGWRRGWW